MNGIEQKNHRIVTKQLSDAIVTVADRTAEQIGDLRKAINDERTHRLLLANEQRGYVDARDRELRECCQERWDETTTALKRGFDNFAAFRGRGFWSRLNWLLTGR